MSILAETYIQDGVAIGAKLLDDNQVYEMRAKLEDLFKRKKYPPRLYLSQIDDDLLKDSIIDLVINTETRNFIKDLERIYGLPIHFCPTIEIQRNNIPHPAHIADGSGWHVDCGGEYLHKYCCDRLQDFEKYGFGKIGIFLQENREDFYGGGIDVKANTHLAIRSTSRLRRFLDNGFLIILKRIHEFLVKFFFNKYINFSKLYLMIGCQTLKPPASSVVLFDSGTWHRATPMSKNIAASHSQWAGARQFSSSLNEHNKYAIYCQFGSLSGVESHIYDHFRRDGNKMYCQEWVSTIKNVPEIFVHSEIPIEKIINENILATANTSLTT